MIQVNENNLVDGKELYLFVNVKTEFHKWVKRCIDYADLKQNVDYWPVLAASTVTKRSSYNYMFTIQAAKEICIVSQTDKAKELRRWLIDLSEKVENKEYLSEKQILELSTLIGFYKYIENQKNIENESKQIYVRNHTGKNYNSKNRN